MSSARVGAAQPSTTPAGPAVPRRWRDSGSSWSPRPAAATRGLLLDPLSRHRIGEHGPAGIVLGWAAPTRAELTVALPQLTEVLQGP